MYHSVTFGDKNSYDDWDLVPSTRPVFAPPPVKTNIIDIPGSNGGLDLTDALNGYAVYSNRTGSIEFTVLNNGGYPQPKNKTRTWSELYSEIANYIHGKRMKAILEDDPSWYYEGRFSIDEWSSDEAWSKIVINYDVYPYKKEIVDSVEPWEWDPFSFEDGIIREYKGLTITNEKSTVISITGSTEIVIPIITVQSSDGSGMDITYSGATVHVYDGTAKEPLLFIRDTTSNMIIQGSGTISIVYRGGSL